MPDLFDSMLGGMSPTLDIKKVAKNTIFNTPILYKSNCEKVKYTFIVDEVMTNRELGVLKKSIEKLGVTEYQILYALQIELDEKDKKKSAWRTYKKFKWDYTKYIPQWSIIVSFGKSIFSICESNDLDASIKYDEINDTKKDLEKNSIVSGFYDTLLDETHFNDPRTKCVVFPVDSWYDIYNRESGILYDKFEYWFFKEQLKKIINYTVRPVKIKPHRHIDVADPNAWLASKLDEVAKDSVISFDLETDGTDMFDPTNFIINISFSFMENSYVGYYLDWNLVDKALLEKFLLKTYHIGSNIGYDYKWLVVRGGLSIEIVKRCIGDTMHLAQIYNTLMRTTLKAHVWICTWFGGYDQNLDNYKEEHPECKLHYGLLPKPIIIPYACQDPSMSLQVHEYFKKKVLEIDEKYPITFVSDSQWSMWRFYSELRINTIKVFVKAEVKGLPVNWDKVDYLSVHVQKQIDDKILTICTMLGVDINTFNINSNDQLGIKLEELGWADYGRNKKRIYNVNDYTLQRWKEDGHEVASLIDDLHKLNTVYKTFIGNEEDTDDDIQSTASVDMVSILDSGYTNQPIVKKKKTGKVTGYYQYRKVDGCVHPNYGVGMNNTGRNNCRNPNLQNNKKHGFLSSEMRDFFSPSDEDRFCIGEQDGASLQLRIEASLSGDKEMEKLFKANIDMHSLTGHMLFGQGVSFEDFCAKVKAKDQFYVDARYSAKAPNFSLCFGSTALSFAKDSLYQGPYKWSLDQCKSYIKLHDIKDLVEEKYDKLIENPNIHDTPEVFSLYWACAEDIKEKWMAKYKGIEIYIQFKIKEGEKYGACFTPYGFIRRVPWLKYCRGEDEDKGRVKNCQNIVSNVPAQTVEWVMVSKTMIAEDRCIEENGFNSYIAGNVHDSIVSIFDYDEVYPIVKVGQDTFCEDVPENKGIPYGIECELGIWGFGEGFKLNDLKDPIKVREKVKLNNIKQRSKMIYKEAV